MHAIMEYDKHQEQKIMRSELKSTRSEHNSKLKA